MLLFQVLIINKERYTHQQKPERLIPFWFLLVGVFSSLNGFDSKQLKHAIFINENIYVNLLNFSKNQLDVQNHYICLFIS